MSGNKYTSRGFSASGASQSSWKAPRDSYGAPKDNGSSFLFGGAGLRGSPKSGAQHRSIPTGVGGQIGSQASRVLEQEGMGIPKRDQSERSRGIDLSGGDRTTTKLERGVLFVGLLVAAVICSMLFRACAGGSDSSWVQEHRARINPDD